ncbi:MAG: hypothetical protein HWD61_11260 [Parachlamydiaceae bacterium]|nr:MAG: hypothetical protein HWD61_11260 [Parachlamydiaceae bacterium]
MTDERNHVLCSAVETYIRFGKLEEAMATIDLISNSSWKNFALIDLAKAYVNIDSNKAIQILGRVNRNDDLYKELKIKVYALFDLEKAQEICNQIRAPDYKIKALFTISKVLKKTDLQAATQMWETILTLTVHLNNVYQPYLNILKITREMAELNPSQAKAFLENKLAPLTRRQLFEGVLQDQRRASRFSISHLKYLIAAYSRIDPVETETWLKECNGRIASGHHSRALMELKDSL